MNSTLTEDDKRCLAVINAATAFRKSSEKVEAGLMLRIQTLEAALAGACRSKQSDMLDKKEIADLSVQAIKLLDQPDFLVTVLTQIGDIARRDE